MDEDQEQLLNEIHALVMQEYESIGAGDIISIIDNNQTVSYNLVCTALGLTVSDGDNNVHVHCEETQKELKGFDAIQYCIYKKYTKFNELYSMLADSDPELDSHPLHGGHGDSGAITTTNPETGMRLEQLFLILKGCEDFLGSFDTLRYGCNDELYHEWQSMNHKMVWHDAYNRTNNMRTARGKLNGPGVVLHNCEQEILKNDYRKRGDELFCPVVIKFKRPVIWRGEYVCEQCGRPESEHPKEADVSLKKDHVFRRLAIPVRGSETRTLAYKRYKKISKFVDWVVRPERKSLNQLSKDNLKCVENVTHRIMTCSSKHVEDLVVEPGLYVFEDYTIFGGARVNKATGKMSNSRVQIWPNHGCTCHEHWSYTGFTSTGAAYETTAYGIPIEELPRRVLHNHEQRWAIKIGNEEEKVYDSIPSDNRPSRCASCGAGYAPKHVCAVKYFEGVYFDHATLLKQMVGPHADTTCAHCGKACDDDDHIPECTFHPSPFDYNTCHHCGNAWDADVHKPVCRIKFASAPFRDTKLASKCYFCDRDFEHCRCPSYANFKLTQQSMTEHGWWDSIYDYQNIPRTVTKFLTMLVARVALPAQSMDAFQIFIYLWGTSGCGKSTFLDFVSHLFRQEDIAVVSDVAQETFGLMHAVDRTETKTKPCLIFPDGSPKYLSISEFLTWADAPKNKTIQMKHKQTANVEVISTALIASNEPFPRNSSQGQLERRCICIRFDKRVRKERADGILKDRLCKREAPAIIFQAFTHMLIHGKKRFAMTYDRYLSSVIEESARNYLHNTNQLLGDSVNPMRYFLRESVNYGLQIVGCEDTDIARLEAENATPKRVIPANLFFQKYKRAMCSRENPSHDLYSHVFRQKKLIYNQRDLHPILYTTADGTQKNISGPHIYGIVNLETQPAAEVDGLAGDSNGSMQVDEEEEDRTLENNYAKIGSLLSKSEEEWSSGVAQFTGHLSMNTMKRQMELWTRRARMGMSPAEHQQLATMFQEFALSIQDTSLRYRDIEIISGGQGFDVGDVLDDDEFKFVVRQVDDNGGITAVNIDVAPNHDEMLEYGEFRFRMIDGRKRQRSE